MVEERENPVKGKWRRGRREEPNHVGGEIGGRMKAKDYWMQINRRTHRSTDTHMHMGFTLLTIKFCWANPNYYN